MDLQSFLGGDCSGFVVFLGGDCSGFVVFLGGDCSGFVLFLKLKIKILVSCLDLLCSCSLS